MEGPFSCNGHNPMFHLDSATHRSFFRILHHIKSGSILGDVFGSGESNGNGNLQEELPNTSEKPAEAATSGELGQVSHSDDVLNSKYALSDVHADLESVFDVSVEENQRSPSEILSQNENIEISKGIGQLSSVGNGPSIRLDLEADEDVHQKQHSPAKDLTHVRLVEVPEELRQVDHAVTESTNRLSYSDVSAGLEQDNSGIYEKQISAGTNVCVSARLGSLGELNQVDSAGYKLLSDENTLESFWEEGQELGLLEFQKELIECIKSKNDVTAICENLSAAKLPEEKDCEDVEMLDNSRQGSHQDESLKHGKQEMGHGHVASDGNEDSQCQSTMPMESKNETRPSEMLDEANLLKLQSVLPDAEIPCLVEKSGDEDLQVNPMGSSGNSQNLDEMRITDPVKNSSLDNLGLEEGEILSNVEEAVQSPNREEKDIEIGVKIPTESSNENLMKKANSTLPPLKTPSSKVGCTIGQDSTEKIDERSHRSFAVDYSDLYGTDHAPRIGKSIGPLENKNVTREIKKNKSRMTVATPKDRDRLKDDGSNLMSFREGIAKGMKRASELEESDLKDVGGREKKKKKGPPTEERKAKKKLVKKRKRAEQNRKLGIKRLKIQPVSVPKKVTYCNFYLKGRCQQGDTCKFSHDTTPLTKSQPCKYFACQSCLKGDDCPFDHELWKYPCHNFTSKGACSRGDSCMFSHKITAVEKPEECAVGNLESLKLSEKPSSEKPTNSTVNSVASLTCPPSAHMNLEEEQSAKRQTPVKVPRGIRFLSVGRPSLEKANNFESESTLKKFDAAGIQDKQEGVFDKLQKSNEISLRLPGIGAPGMMAQRQPSLIGSNLMSSTASKVPALGASESSKKSKVGIIDTGSDKASSHGSTANDKTDAIKLLEEFMFGGI